MAQDPSGSGPDKRRTARVGVPKVVVRVPSADRFRSHYLRDLSEGGLFIRAEKMIPLGTELLLELWPPGESEPLTLPSRVVRNVEPANATASQSPGVAVSFAGVSPEQQLRLKQLIEQYGVPLSESGGEDPLGKVQRMMADLEEARGHISSLATELAEARGQLEGYAEQIRHLEADELASRNAAEQVGAAAAELEQEVKKLKTENQELRKRIEGSDRAAGEVASMRNKVAESQKELEAAKSRERDLGKLLSGVGMKPPGGKQKAAVAQKAAPAPLHDSDEVIVVEAGAKPRDEPIELMPKKKAAKPAPVRQAPVPQVIEEAIDLDLPSNDDIAESPPPRKPGFDLLLESEDIELNEEPPAPKPSPKSSPPKAPATALTDDLESFLSGDETADVAVDEQMLDQTLEIEETQPHDSELAGGPAGFVLETSIVDGRVGYPQFAKKLKQSTRLMPNDALNKRKPTSVDEALLSELIAAAPTFGTLMNQIGGQLKEERLKQLLYELYARALIDLRDY